MKGYKRRGRFFHPDFPGWNVSDLILVYVEEAGLSGITTVALVDKIRKEIEISKNTIYRLIAREEARGNIEKFGRRIAQDSVGRMTYSRVLYFIGFSNMPEDIENHIRSKK